MESVDNVVTNTIPEFVGTIIEHALYPFQVENKICDLESAARDLVALKEDTKTSIEIAERQNGSPTKQIVEWVNKVEAMEKEAEEIQKNNRKRRWSLWSNYTTSRNVVRKLSQIKNLCDQKATIQVIAHLPPPLAQEMIASSSKSPNLESALHDIKVHCIIGIWGMGGVGKTHLLKQINNELTRDPSFNVVIFVTCSKACSEETIQNEIICMLHLNENGSTDKKKSTIYNFLKEKSFALLLDDLWNRVDLETIGIPDPVNAPGTTKRKIILTTRSTEVCGQMEVKKRIRADVLSWDDAWSLFKEKVTEETINSDPLIQKCAVDVVKELGGLPLALITVGRAMHDKMDPSEWEQAIVLLKQARLNDVELSRASQSVFYIMKFSYDNLKNDILKECFLHCSLWPEDHTIPRNSLVELWMGLGLINERDIKSAYNIGYSYIRRLQAVCLLEKFGDYDSKMHDVIRDMTLWIANNQGVESNKWIVRARTYKEQQEIKVFHDTKILSVMNNYTDKFFVSFKCVSTKTSTLLLNHNSLNDLKSLQLELFSKLTVLDLSSNRLKVFPVEICKLLHLQFLNLSRNPLKSLPEELGGLTNLRYLLLKKINCNFPNRILFRLKALRVLDLSFYGYDINGNREIFPMIEKDLWCLPDFQALGISISSILSFRKFSHTVRVPVRWFDVHNYKGSCLSISSCFLENSQLQNNLVFLGIRHSDYVECVKFESTSENRSICQLARLEHLCFLGMSNIKEVIWKSLDPKDVFPRLQVVELRFCDRLTSISWVVNLSCIRKLTVHACPSIKQLICIDEMTSSGVIASQLSFPFLNTIILIANEKLESISDTMITFPALEYLGVDGCEKLKKLPFHPSNPPNKLELIEGTEEWWNNIVMEDDCLRYSLQPFFKKLNSRQ